MSARDDVLRELDRLGETELAELLALLRARRFRGADVALLSETALARDWLRPEEDAAWADL